MISAEKRKRLFACVLLRKDGSAPDSEASQAVVRGKGSLAYVLLLCLLDLAGCGERLSAAWLPAIVYASFSYAWVFVVGLGMFDAPTRKAASLILDYVIFAFGFYYGEAGFALVFWAPIFATIGYGLRYGVRYALYSLIFGGVLIGTALFLSPYWQTLPLMAGGIAVSFAALPVYAFVLSRRIEQSRSEAQAMAQRFEKDSQTDALTGLLNRRGFAARLIDRRRPSGRSALLYIDLDGFKRVNDLAGHAAGDRVLVDVAQCLNGCLRSSDIVGRLGGDEFAALLTNLLRPDDAETLARVVIEAIAAIRIGAPGELKIGASIGIVHLPDAEIGDAEALLGRADALMYRAKQAGKNRYISSTDVVADELALTCPQF